MALAFVEILYYYNDIVISVSISINCRPYYLITVIMPEVPTVEIINFGDELLVGIRENAHLTYLGEQLSKYGLSVRRARIIKDSKEEIEKAFAEAWAQSDLIITTGGLGPTADDLTRETIANVLGAELVYDPEIKQVIEDRFSAIGYRMADHHIQQCYRFKEGRVLRNDQGTAPGLVYRNDGKMLILLPGPTQELKPMFEQQVLPFLQAEGILSDEPTFIQMRTCGLGESAVEARLRPLAESYDDLQLAYCAHYGIVDVRFSSLAGLLSSEQLEAVSRQGHRLMEDHFVCFGDCSLAGAVQRELRALDRTLAVAESCTGGLLSDAFTDIPGASKSFLGGIVCYANDVKVAQLGVPESILSQHGAVSVECAIAMASGVAERLSSDYGLSVTGFAGPGGGNAGNPVGTVHLGYHSPIGVWGKTLRYTGGRLDVKTRAVHAALDWMRRNLRQYKVEELLSSSDSE